MPPVVTATCSPLAVIVHRESTCEQAISEKSPPACRGTTRIAGRMNSRTSDLAVAAHTSTFIRAQSRMNATALLFPGYWESHRVMRCGARRAGANGPPLKACAAKKATRPPLSAGAVITKASPSASAAHARARVLSDRLAVLADVLRFVTVERGAYDRVQVISQESNLLYEIAWCTRRPNFQRERWPAHRSPIYNVSRMSTHKFP
jgi:hypothetical protein